jgi:hypothetical protein
MAAPISARRFIYPTLLAYTLATLAINLKSARQTKETDLASLTAQATTLQRLLATSALDSAQVDRDLKAVGLPASQPSTGTLNSDVRPFRNDSTGLMVWYRRKRVNERSHLSSLRPADGISSSLRPSPTSPTAHS